MKQKIIALSLGLVCLFHCSWGQAQKTRTDTGLWKDIQEIALPKSGKEEPLLPEKFRLLELDLTRLEAILEQVPRQTPDKPEKNRALLEVPLPDGTFQQFSVENAPVMHPSLAAKFPEINSYAGHGVDDRGVKIYFDFNPFGFHAMILTAGKPPFFIEPVSKSDTEHYLCYEYSPGDWEKMKTGCSNLAGSEAHNLNGPAGASKAGDCQLRTYDLVLSANVEFTTAFVNPMTDPTGANGVMNTFNTLVTFVNGFYITELAIQLQLVNTLIFTAATGDSYTNGNEATMAGENQAVVDGAIGNANYDVARAYGTFAGPGARGISLEIGNACVNANKAHGATVIANPANLATGGFATLEMHELGHQFGANHTFNETNSGSCVAGQLSAATAFEPGSGSTIMSYGGTCGASDVQGFRSNYFHTISLQEIGNYVTVGNGSTCPATVALANNAPTVSAGGVGTFNIPISTPFMLIATANDADGDPLTFCWEQFDNQLISHPPQSTATNGPVFRSFSPTASPTRFFPNLAAILSGTTPTWEVLPGVSRTMNFFVTARDNAPGGGCTDEDAVQVDVFDSAGPFLVTSPVSGDCFAAEGAMTVTWSVAGTNGGDVNCANVDILLSLDGGQTFPITLASATPNDGTENVTLPDLITEQGRIMVRGSGNIFFNISQGDFEIDCISVLTVTDNPASGIYRARERVQTSGDVRVLAATSAQFFAGEAVVLNPGFWAMLGCDFLARIQPCDPCVGPKAEVLAVVAKENPKVYFYEMPGESRAPSAGDIASPFKAVVFPNPFNQDFTIAFEMPAAGKVEIQLFDFTGRLIQTVFQHENLEAGAHRVPVFTNPLKSGVYDCRIISDHNREQIKVVKIN